MKKKILSFVLTLCLAVVCTTAFACGGSQGLTKQDYSKAFDSVTTAYNGFIGGAQGSQLQSMRAEVNGDDLITLDRTSQMTRMSTACVQFVRFLKNLCDSETFELTDEFQNISVVDNTVEDYEYNYKMRIKMTYSKESSIISSEVYVEDESSVSYLIFDILFDFGSETLDYFTITGAMGSGELDTDNVNYFKFKNNSLSMLSTSAESFQTYAESILADLETVKPAEWGTDLPDFSTEYYNAMMGV